MNLPHRLLCSFDIVLISAPMPFLLGIHSSMMDVSILFVYLIFCVNVAIHVIHFNGVCSV